AASGDDTVRSSISYTLTANVERLVLTGLDASSGTGNILDNVITGNDAANLLSGGAGNDRLIGGLGADTLSGGAGDDFFSLDDVADVVVELAGAGTDTVESSFTYVLGENLENLTLTGSAVINATGNAGANVIVGNGVANVLDGGAGADAMDGGGGNDTYIVDNNGDTVTEAAFGGTDLVQSAVTFTLGSEVENLTLTGAGAINGTGNALSNLIIGNEAGNTLSGGGGRDQLSGKGGDDTLLGGDGDDDLEGGAGADSMVGGAGSDRYYVDSLGDTVTELDGGGFDTVTSSVSFVLGANLENLVLSGNAAVNATGNALANVINGNAGNNIIDGGAGADNLGGGGGNDTYYVDDIGDVVFDDQGVDWVYSSVTFTLADGVDRLTLTGTAAVNGTGNAGVNQLFGNSAANILTAGAGNDLLDGGAGADRMVGGLGDDTYFVDDSSDLVVEAANEGTDIVQSSATFVLGANVENLTLTGTASANGTGNVLNNILIGNAGNNILDGGAGSDQMIGGLGDDTYVVDVFTDAVTEAVDGGTDTIRSSISWTLGTTLENVTLTGTLDITATGNAGSNRLLGNDGSNALNGLGGADYLEGGNGNDIYVVDNAGDVLVETAGGGADSVQSSIDFQLAANFENLTLTGPAKVGIGNSGANVITGNAEDNLLDGREGADQLSGGGGNDTYVIDTAGEVVTEYSGFGVDLVLSAVTYTLGSEVENLTLTGTGAIDGTGNELDNRLIGNDAANALWGGIGNDYLDGGAGADALRGNSGDDVYVVDSLSDAIFEALNEGWDEVRSSVDYTLSAYLEVVRLTGSAAVNATGNNSDGNQLYGNSGANVLDGRAGGDYMVGGGGDDVYIVDNSGDGVVEAAGEGTDEVRSSVGFALGANVENLTLTGAGGINGTGNSLDNIINGNSGANLLNGGAGADTLRGGAGNDTYLVESTLDIVEELAEEGVDTVNSSVSFELGLGVDNLTLTGTGAIDGTGNGLNNVITGNASANVLIGGAGDDTLDGGAGIDRMAGGTGNDSYVVGEAGDIVTELAGEGIDTVRSAVSFVLSPTLENLILTGSLAVDGTGNDLANMLSGNAGNNVLDGGAGADSMTGGAGNDTFVVDDSGDTVSEAIAGGIDLVKSSVGFVLGLELENLTLTGTAAVSGTGNAVANIISGNMGANVLDGGAGADTLTGGAGDDTYVVDSAADIVVELAGEGTDSVQSGVAFTLSDNLENLTLTGLNAISGTGNGSDNRLIGNGAANVLDAGGGNDFLDGGAGADTMTGGGGDDTYVVDVASDVVTESAGGGLDTVMSAATSYTLSSDVERLELTGTGSNSGTGNALDNRIVGNSGSNQLDGKEGADVLIGGLGNDFYWVDNASDMVVEEENAGTDTVVSTVTWVLGANLERLNLAGVQAINGTGNALNNIINGNLGANILDGGAGSDTMQGAGGDDTYIVDVSQDIVTEAAGGGLDIVFASASFVLGFEVDNLTLTGNGDFNATGNALANILIGNGGNNILNGNAGADRMSGGMGDDSYTVDNIGDVVTELAGEGTDTVISRIDYTLGANLENLVLQVGTTGTGNALSNVITGNASNNSLSGGAGDDRLDGQEGADSMVGGAGDDVFIVDNLGDTASEAAGGGTDSVVSSVSFTLGANVENLTLTGLGAIGGTGNILSNVIIGNSGANTLIGGEGDDDLDGQGGSDRLDGGAGNDIYHVDTLGDQVVEVAGGGADLVYSSLTFVLAEELENLTLIGSSALDGTGNSAVNVIVGNDGSNRLDGRSGADRLAGGGGDDVYVVDSTGDIVEEQSGKGNDRVESSVSFALPDQVEDLTLTGSASIDGTGTSANNILLGNSGANRLDGNGGTDTLAGGAGDDVYVVNGDDVIIEAAGGGIDTVVSSVTFQLAPELENLVLSGASAAAGTGNDADNLITGNSAANALNGGAGSDVLDGAGGADTMTGGSGNDRFIVDNVGDKVVEVLGEGSDEVRSSVSYVLGANVENLVLTGGANISATGNGVDNVLSGNSGNNVLDGLGGADAMAGGLGNDAYYVDSVGDTVTEDANAGTDTIVTNLAYILGANLEGLTLTGSANLSGTGNELANALTGNTGNNILNGMGGADVMAGGAGDDTYIVDHSGDKANEVAGGGSDIVLASVSYTLGAEVERLTLTGTGNITGVGNALNNVLVGNSGNNTLSGGLGADTMTGGLGNDIYIVDDAGDVVTEGASGGTDTVQTALGYTLGANLENLTLTGTAAVNGTGNALDNFIIGNSAANVLTGNAGNDTLNGGLGADTMAGGIGNDTYVVDEAGDVVTEASGAGTDTVQSAISYTLGANLEVLTLTGVANINGTGNALANVLNGNAGANTLDGGAGADSMFGGNGDDIYIVSDLGDRATEVSAAGGFDTVMSAISFYMTSNIEKIVLTGTAATTAVGNASDNLMIGNSGNNTFVGGGGNDTMTGGLGNDVYYVDQVGDVVNENAGEGTDTVIASLSYTLGATLENLTLTGAAALSGTGNDLNNIITGNSGANTLNGGIGNDTLIGGVGNDTLIGGVGNDTYVIDGGDTLVEAAGEGIDTVQSAISYTLLTNFEVLTLTGTANVNGTGNSADNSLNGNSGNNILDGGAGADGMFGGLGNDTYIVDNVADKAVETSAVGGTDEVKSSVTFVLGGNVENLTLTGSAAVNGFGNTLDNVITGNSANNSLAGGGGADTLDGKGGIDSFLYTNTSDSTSAAMDHILGFTAGEKIDLSGIDASTTAAGNNAFSFVGAAAFSHTAGELRAYQSGSEWFVEADTDGDGAANLIISVASDHALLVGDFVV
ncbi:MAG: hypothetical protein E6G94_13420, partial [Alphaproteobacteria bacterium]